MPRLGDERPVVMVVRDGNKLPLAKSDRSALVLCHRHLLTRRNPCSPQGSPPARRAPSQSLQRAAVPCAGLALDPAAGRVALGPGPPARTTRPFSRLQVPAHARSPPSTLHAIERALQAPRFGNCAELARTAPGKLPIDHVPDAVVGHALPAAHRNARPHHPALLTFDARPTTHVDLDSQHHRLHSTPTSTSTTTTALPTEPWGPGSLSQQGFGVGPARPDGAVT